MSRSALRLAITASLTCAVLLPAAAEAKNRKPECAAGYQWTSSRRGFVTTWRDSVENGTSANQSKTFTVEVTKTVGRKITAGVESEVSGGFIAVQASVKAQFGIETSSELTVKRGESETITIRPYRRVVYRYGVNVLKLRGMALKAVPDDFVGPLRPIPGLPADCRMIKVKSVTATVPMYAGSKTTQTRVKR